MGIIGEPNFVKCIDDMDVGESGYTFPWALVYDSERIPYLNVKMYVYSDKSKRVEEDIKERIFIKRTGPGAEDFNIDITDCNFEFDQDEDLEDMIMEGYCDFVCLDPKKAKEIAECWNQYQSEEEGYVISGGALSGNEWKKTPQLEIPEISPLYVDDDKKRFPNTYEMRKDLNAMIDNELYEDASELRDSINLTNEPLEGYDSCDITIDDIAAKVVARKKPCPTDSKKFSLTHKYRKNLNVLKSEGYYDCALEVAVLINSTSEPLEL